jgi:hypothetical protein
VPSVVRAAKGKSTADEKKLYDIYNKVMHIAASEKAVSQGQMFDLMYVNGKYHRQYIFLRKAGAEVLLVVANFDDSTAAVNVTIPAHAFDFLSIKEKNAVATDLLTGSQFKITLKRDSEIPLVVDPLSAIVLKFKA